MEVRRRTGSQTACVRVGNAKERDMSCSLPSWYDPQPCIGQTNGRHDGLREAVRGSAAVEAYGMKTCGS